MAGKSYLPSIPRIRSCQNPKLETRGVSPALHLGYAHAKRLHHWTANRQHLRNGGMMHIRIQGLRSMIWCLVLRDLQIFRPENVEMRMNCQATIFEGQNVYIIFDSLGSEASKIDQKWLDARLMAFCACSLHHGGRGWGPWAHLAHPKTLNPIPWMGFLGSPREPQNPQPYTLNPGWGSWAHLAHPKSLNPKP